MRKLILAVFLFLFLITFFFVGNALAIETSVGASSWYCWWESLDSENDMNLNPTLVYGPVLSMRFDESWSLAGVFLYGKYHSSSTENGGPNTISRYDSDLSLNYNLNRYFKIFGGGKFMGFNWDETNGDGSHWTAGPGLGLGTTLPLTNSLYLLFNISGTYSFGKHNQTREQTPGIIVNTHQSINERGLNTNLSIAYYIASASTSINLGFRYQYLYIHYKDPIDQQSDEKYNFYGPTLSIVYSF